MRWFRLNEKSTRIRKGFLFFPKTMQGQTRWLEMAEWSQKRGGFVEMNWPGSFWVDHYWIT